jgi:class 3 adenylate cyclase
MRPAPSIAFVRIEPSYLSPKLPSITAESLSSWATAYLLSLEASLTLSSAPAALQRGLAERNANVPDEQRIDVRIGINLGEVIVEGDDRFGEGVNIAARLEQIAEPGTILVSSKVAHEVEKKLAFGFEPMGQQKVKNIAKPITVFRGQTG